jgi:hypothetical protein
VVGAYVPDGEPELLTHPAIMEASGVVAGFKLVMARIWE